MKYEKTTSRLSELISTLLANTPTPCCGDPAKAAHAVLQIASQKEPPLRPPLWSDAVFLADLIASSRAAEDAKWKTLSMSMDFDGVPEFAETPVAKMLAAPRR